MKIEVKEANDRFADNPDDKDQIKIESWAPIELKDDRLIISVKFA